MGAKVAEATAELFAANAYRDYLELHGLSVQLTEALAEMWHARVREELGFGADDDPDLDAILRQGYRGSRYSFGYPACPDLEDRAMLVELLGPGAHRRRAVRGAAAAPRAVDRRHRGPPPRGQVLQRDLNRRAARAVRLWGTASVVRVRAGEGPDLSATTPFLYRVAEDRDVSGAFLPVGKQRKRQHMEWLEPAQPTI